mgnify:CR=1 FL=1|jgi:hypothetical protein
MNTQVSSNTPEKQHLELLLGKCRNEARSEQLYNHLQALKTYLLVYLIQQNTLTYQIRNGEIVEGSLEDHLVENCTRCVGECKQIMRSLHKLLRRYEAGGTDSMDFRVKATRVIIKLEQNIDRFNEIMGE